MTEGTVHNKIETADDFGEQVKNEIVSLRDEVASIRSLLEQQFGGSLERAIREFNFFTGRGIEKPIRWGIMGVWGKEGSRSAHSIHSTSEEDFFNAPNATDEYVAEFAKAFTNPNTIKICKYIFRDGNPLREEIKKNCNLSDEELDEAVKPLLEWYFADWRDGKLETRGPSINGQGIHYMVTLVSMVKVAVDNKLHGGKANLYT